tara:strand:- start:218 stop:1579 length:1362 start_codon:yes stop_codon:yes gene_type:complete
VEDNAGGSTTAARAMTTIKFEFRFTEAPPFRLDLAPGGWDFLRGSKARASWTNYPATAYSIAKRYADDLTLITLEDSWATAPAGSTDIFNYTAPGVSTGSFASCLGGCVDPDYADYADAEGINASHEDGRESRNRNQDYENQTAARYFECQVFGDGFTANDSGAGMGDISNSDSNNNVWTRKRRCIIAHDRLPKFFSMYDTGNEGTSGSDFPQVPKVGKGGTIAVILENVNKTYLSDSGGDKIKDAYEYMDVLWYIGTGGTNDYDDSDGGSPRASCMWVGVHQLGACFHMGYDKGSKKEWEAGNVEPRVKNYQFNWATGFDYLISVSWKQGCMEEDGDHSGVNYKQVGDHCVVKRRSSGTNDNWSLVLNSDSDNMNFKQKYNGSDTDWGFAAPYAFVDSQSGMTTNGRTGLLIGGPNNGNSDDWLRYGVYDKLYVLATGDAHFFGKYYDQMGW